jgi:hypothetical protein
MNDVCFCEEFKQKFGVDRSCCYSCHNDFDEGYSSLCEREIEGITYCVCCRMLE